MLNYCSTSKIVHETSEATKILQEILKYWDSNVCQIHVPTQLWTCVVPTHRHTGGHTDEIVI